MQKRAFTLIELLVVIVIIGLLTSIATASYLKAQSKSRDSARKSNINAIATGIETYYSQKQSFPGDSGPTQPTTLASCERDSSFSSQYSPYYFAGLTGQCTVNGDPKDFQPVGTWIPGLGSYISPIPIETHLSDCVGNPTISGSGYAPDYLDNSGTACGIQASNLLRTYIYRNLTSGYAVYARLENFDDSDFCGLPTSSFGSDCNVNSLLLTTGSSLPVMPPFLSSVPGRIGNSNPISVYIIRK